ncbi:hypothetical protein LCGC14_0761950 [marine sediment metagenome]|uniref:Uncharacterized protein n=1 Tax=marine sediment metagenome TaxID=412755 RepID=A0A0F9Q4Y2_9ZZZZ|nr:hypothetical protein [bacterium]
MAKKRKLDIFSEEFIIKLLESLDEDGLRDLFHLIETLIKKESMYYRTIPTGKEFGVRSDLKKEVELKLPKVENSEPSETISALMRVIVEFIEGKGEMSIESILGIAEDKLSETLRKNIYLFENLLFKSDIFIKFVIYGSFTETKKLESWDYRININSLIIKKEEEKNLVHAPIGYLSLTYFDPRKGKNDIVNFILSKKFLKKFKKELDNFYDEFEIYENIINQKHKDNIDK